MRVGGGLATVPELAPHSKHSQLLSDMKIKEMFNKSKLAVGGLLASASSAFAQESGGGSFTYATPPGLQDAIATAKGTATGMAGDVLPAAVVIIFAFAGLVGIWLLWRVFKRGASGR